MYLVTDMTALIITILVLIVSITGTAFVSGLFGGLPLAWIGFYLWNEHRTATRWPK